MCTHNQTLVVMTSFGQQDTPSCSQKKCILCYTIYYKNKQDCIYNFSRTPCMY